MSPKKIILLCLLIFSKISAENIIFDLYGVLFKIPYTQALKQFNLLDPLAYAFCEFKNPISFSKKFINILGQIEVPQELKKYLPEVMLAQANGKIMPELFYLWQIDKLSCQDALKLAFYHIDTLKVSDREKRMLKNASIICFDLEVRKQSYKPIAAGIEILNQCAAAKNPDGSKKHKLYILSNMDSAMIEALTQSYPEIFNLFDGIVYSGQVGSLKPQPNIYLELIKKYNLNPQDSIFIDDQEENIIAAKELGISGILCKNFKVVKQELIDKQIFKPEPKGFDKHYIAAGIVLAIGLLSL